MDVSENVGHVMTFSNLNITANKVISRSNARPAGEHTSLNLRIDPLTEPEVVTSSHPSSHHLKDDEEDPAITEDEPPDTSTSSPKHKIHILHPNDLVRDFSYSARRWSTSTSQNIQSYR